MNKYWLMLIFLAFSFSIQAQLKKYFSFPDSNATWCEIDTWIDDDPCDPDKYLQYTDYYDFYSNGDTVVNTKKYIKIHWSAGVLAGVCGGSSWYSQDSLYALIRDDTVAKKVYASFAPNFIRDTLLYDFSLNVGDTLPAGYLNYYPGNAYVYAIDSILIGSNYRKYYFIADTFGNIIDSIIEGIGNRLGLFTLYAQQYVSLTTKYLIDFTEPPIYFPTVDTCQRYILSIPPTIIDNPNIKVYPNPANSRLYIEITNVEGAVNLSLYNIFSQEMITEQVNAQDKIMLNVSKFPSGIYLLKVQPENGTIVTQKVIIER